MSRDAFADVAAILHPLPDPPDDVQDVDGYEAAHEQTEQDRQLTAEQLRLGWEEGDHDPVLSALASARWAKEHAETQIRHLIAYGREFGRRPYTLNELAETAGMSVSGVRTGYDHHDVNEVADATGARPRDWRATDPDETDPAEIEALLHEMQRRSPEPARGRVVQLYYLLREQGWTPYPPAARAPGTKATKRYIRWVRRWPGGTTVTLYQEPGNLAASGKVAESEPRRFAIDYAAHDIPQVVEQLAELTRRIDDADQAHAAVPAS